MPKFIGTEAREYVLPIDVHDGDKPATKKELKKADSFNINAIELEHGELKLVDIDSKKGIVNVEIDGERFIIPKSKVKKFQKLTRGKKKVALRLIYAKKTGVGNPVIEDIWVKRKEITENDAILIGENLAVRMSREAGVNVRSVAFEHQPLEFYRHLEKVPLDVAIKRGYNISGSEERRLRTNEKGVVGEFIVRCHTSNLGGYNDSIQICHGVKVKKVDDEYFVEEFTRAIKRTISNEYVGREGAKTVKNIVSNDEVIDIPESRIKIESGDVGVETVDIFNQIDNIPSKRMFFDRKDKFDPKREKLFFALFVENSTTNIGVGKLDKEALTKEFSRRLDTNVRKNTNTTDILVSTLMDVITDATLVGEGNRTNPMFKKRAKQYLSSVVNLKDRFGVDIL